MNPLLTLAFDGCQWSASNPSLFNPGKRRLGKAQSQYGGFGEQKVLFLLTGMKPQISTLRIGKLHIIYEDSLFFALFSRLPQRNRNMRKSVRRKCLHPLKFCAR